MKQGIRRGKDGGGKGSLPGPTEWWRTGMVRQSTLAGIGAGLFLGVLVWLVAAVDRGGIPAFFSFHEIIPHGDALGHFCLMGTFSFLAMLAMPGRWCRIGRIRIPSAASVVLVLVVAEEVSQIFIVGRTFSWVDLTADLLGIALAGRLALRLWPKDS